MIILFSLLAILFSFQLHGRAEDISLDQLLDLVLRSHPLINQEILAPQIQEMGRDRYLTEQDWFLNGGPAFYHSKPIATSPFSPTTIDRLSQDVFLQRKFWSTGGSLLLGWTTLFTKQSLTDIQIPTGTGLFSIPSGAASLYEHTI